MFFQSSGLGRGGKVTPLTGNAELGTRKLETLYAVTFAAAQSLACLSLR
jgi:hypothetical protein